MILAFLIVIGCEIVTLRKKRKRKIDKFIFIDSGVISAAMIYFLMYERYAVVEPFKGMKARRK